MLAYFSLLVNFRQHACIVGNSLQTLIGNQDKAVVQKEAEYKAATAKHDHTSQHFTMLDTLFMASAYL